MPMYVGFHEMRERFELRFELYAIRTFTLCAEGIIWGVQILENAVCTVLYRVYLA